MGTTGLIYVAIVAAWAAYLVPMMLKRSDEVNQRRSAEKYSSSAARVLSRQSDVQSRSRYAVRPAGSESALVTDPSPPQQYVPNRARRVAAMRRRRVLSILTLSLLSVTALAGLGMLLWWTVAIPSTLIVAFVVLTRVQLRRQARERAALAAERRARAEARHESGPATAPSSPDHELTVEVKLPVAPEPVVQPKPAVATEGLWDPVPVTLPTYVMKEKAPDRTVRTISLSGPEVFSSARTADPEPEAARAVPEPAIEAEEPEIRRAVGD
jgi:cytoskeletal protein RodZ